MQQLFPEDYAQRQYTFSSGYNTELCGKWLVLRNLLKQWKKEGAKVLIFSQWTRMMDMLGYWLEQDFPGYVCPSNFGNQSYIKLNCVTFFHPPRFVRLDGSVPTSERLAIVDSFQQDPDKFIFLVSTLAGGVGLNLTAANKVVIFDVSVL